VIAGSMTEKNFYVGAEKVSVPGGPDALTMVRERECRFTSHIQDVHKVINFLLK
jgi:hypothetical protein